MGPEFCISHKLAGDDNADHAPEDESSHKGGQGHLCAASEEGPWIHGWVSLCL